MVDIIYFAKGEENEELRYSIRSVCKNFARPFNKLIIVGEKPHYITPDLFIPVTQDGNSKYENVRNGIEKILYNDEISDEFILMNDDFFIMKNLSDLQYYYDNTLYDLAGRIIAKFNGFTRYSAKILEEAKFLKQHGLPQKNYELHVPMLINKHQAKEMIEKFKGYYCFRSTYGNLYCNDKSRALKDVKNTKDYRNKLFLSTDNKTFNGELGEFIKRKFKNNSRIWYEQ